MENRLKKVREEKGLTQEELAKKAGVSRITIVGIETGRTQVTRTDTLAKIADAVGKTIPELFFCP